MNTEITPQKVAEKMNLLKCPTWWEFQFDMTQGKSMTFDFGKYCSGSPFTWYISEEGKFIRSTTLYTPKIYPTMKSAYTSMRSFFKKYGLAVNP